MSSTTNDPTKKFRRVFASLLILCLSIILPAYIVLWSVNSVMSEKPWRMASAESRRYADGCVRNGELWFPVHRYFGGWDGRLKQTRIERLNLATGSVSATELIIENESAQPVWMNDQLYVFSQTAVYKMEGTSINKLASIPRGSGILHVTPFLLNGQLTTVVETLDKSGLPREDEFRLVHLIDGRWVDGRKIVLPGHGRVWDNGPKRARRSILPRTAQQPVPKGPPFGRKEFYLAIAVRGKTVHLFFEAGPTFNAYRCGFEFVDEEDDCASALAPENSPRDVSGWEWTGQLVVNSEGLANNLANQHDVLVFLKGRRNGFVARSQDAQGRFSEKSRFWFSDFVVSGPIRNFSQLMFDETGDCAYLVSTSDRWDSATFRRFEGNKVQPVHLTIPGSEREYLTLWKHLVLAILFAWLVHLFLVTVGTDVALSRAPLSTYEFGVQQVTLASTRRRALALMIDAILISAAAVAAIFIQLWIFQTKWDGSTEREICESLFQVEDSSPFKIPLKAVEALRVVVFGPSFQPAFHNLTIIVGIVTVIVLSCLKFYIEGHKGITPGKWLLGIRTVRSTLRPSGFARAMVRDVLYWVDIPMFLTPLPAAFSMMLSPQRQRFGDRVADTIVIGTAGLAASKKGSE